MKSNRRTRRMARRLFQQCLVDGIVDETRARTIAERIVTSARRRSLPVAWDFVRRVRIDLSRHTAVVESAAELPEDIRHDVIARLTTTYGAGLKTVFTVNPALVGGISIKVGSDVYDGSIRGKLAALEARL